MRDLFSEGSEYYAAFRPGYPPSLAEHVLEYTKERKTAWDCATGNGQAAILFSPYFEKVIATDLSEKQISNAIKAENIHYRIAIAEDSGIEENSIDLVMVAQAYHWFDPIKFEMEVRRVCKPGAIIAVWGYSLFQTEDETLNQAIETFYSVTTGPYWDPERKMLEEKYQHISFPYEELTPYESQKIVNWTSAKLEGYLNSWSAVKHYKDSNGTNPVPAFIDSIRDLLPEEFQVMFPLFMRLGRV